MVHSNTVTCITYKIDLVKKYNYVSIAESWLFIMQFSGCCISHVLFQLMEITVSGQNSCNAVLHVAKEYRHVPEAVLTHLLNTVEKIARHLAHLWKLKSATWKNVQVRICAFNLWFFLFNMMKIKWLINPTLFFLVDGGYSPFTNWSDCTETCGGGEQIRTRTCTNPEPKLGGKDCSSFGLDYEKRKCNTQKCPGQL